MQDETEKPTVRPASRMMQAMYGSGKIKKKDIEKAQNVLENVRGNLDISEFIQNHLNDISNVLKNIEAGKDDKEIIEQATHSLVDFKSNAGMFAEGKYINLSILLFQWMESIETIDEDSTDIIQWYFVIMNKILIEKDIPDGHIDLITKEMNEACKRYYAKHPEITPAKIIDNIDTVFDDMSS
ncbi:MAG: hypothetical protein AAF569_06380 [Pseudomonadota bacterium]